MVNDSARPVNYRHASGRQGGRDWEDGVVTVAEHGAVGYRIDQNMRPVTSFADDDRIAHENAHQENRCLTPRQDGNNPKAEPYWVAHVVPEFVKVITSRITE
jgi:hypothetical protein